MTWYMYIFKMMTTIKLVNIFITLHNYNCVCVYGEHISYLLSSNFIQYIIINYSHRIVHSHTHT